MDAAKEKPEEPRSLAQLNRMLAAAPPMVEGGTRAVPGEGPRHALLALVGEQPGDQEDREGRPFVGPAGWLLDRALQEAGVERDKSYVTNAVKHFKFIRRGKRRIHSKPTAGEVRHYRWWLERELDLVQPRLVVALGATAALALAGKPVAIGRGRGPMVLDGRPGYVTIHPSFILRMPQEDRAAAFRAFVADLKKAKGLAERAA
ncbi:MAG: uracil-DNA glycosylase [Alphaproteobacteria bacterium 64-11]|nr:MAG: uracil-DNA glycosylase [Alphaproteobacteria bacterium 64-11]